HYKLTCRGLRWLFIIASLRKLLAFPFSWKPAASSILWDFLFGPLQIRQWRIQKHSVGHRLRITSTHLRSTRGLPQPRLRSRVALSFHVLSQDRISANTK